MGTSTHGTNHNYKRKKVASMEHIVTTRGTKFSICRTNHDFMGEKMLPPLEQMTTSRGAKF
jgi:hypothetical protein